MNKAIALTSEIEDADVAEIAIRSGKFVTIFDPRSKDGKLLSMPDFGTVLIGFSSKEEIDAEELIPHFVGETDLVWLAPSEWKMGHLAKRFGMFPSASQATKNGFGGDIPMGFSQAQFRANKMRGILSIFKRA